MNLNGERLTEGQERTIRYALEVLARQLPDEPNALLIDYAIGVKTLRELIYKGTVAVPGLDPQVNELALQVEDHEKRIEVVEGTTTVVRQSIDGLLAHVGDIEEAALERQTGSMQIKDAIMKLGAMQNMTWNETSKKWEDTKK